MKEIILLTKEECIFFGLLSVGSRVSHLIFTVVPESEEKKGRDDKRYVTKVEIPVEYQVLSTVPRSVV